MKEGKERGHSTSEGIQKQISKRRHYRQLKLVLPSCPLPQTQLSSQEPPKMAGRQTTNLGDVKKMAS